MRNRRTEIGRLNAVDEELDVAADASLLIDDAKTNSRKAAVEIRHEPFQRRSFRAHYRGVSGVAAQRVWNEYAHEVTASRALRVRRDRRLNRCRSRSRTGIRSTPKAKLVGEGARHRRWRPVPSVEDECR